jgi:putative ABC transport system permease protein
VTGCFLDSGDPDAVRGLMELPAVSSVVSVRDAQAVLKEYTRMINAFLAILIALSGLLGGIVIYSVVIINIGERETEFSTLMVQGMSHWEIFSLLLRENNVVTLLGFAAGVPLTALFLEYSNDLFSTEQYTMMMRASGVNYLDGALLTVLFIVMAQAAAWRRIKSLDFLAALKNRA